MGDWYANFISFLRMLTQKTQYSSSGDESTLRLFLNYLTVFESPGLKKNIKAELTAHSQPIREVLQTKELRPFSEYINSLSDDQKTDKVMQFQLELFNVVNSLSIQDREWFWASLSNVYGQIIAC